MMNTFHDNAITYPWIFSRSRFFRCMNSSMMSQGISLEQLKNFPRNSKTPWWQTQVHTLQEIYSEVNFSAMDEILGNDNLNPSTSNNGRHWTKITLTLVASYWAYSPDNKQSELTNSWTLQSASVSRFIVSQNFIVVTGSCKREMISLLHNSKCEWKPWILLVTFSRSIL